MTTPCVSPAEGIPGRTEEDPKTGTGLCLSGGGFRAMLFHVGSLWRLNELGYLPKLDRISSVSGGSITSAVLALAWERLEFDAAGRATNFESLVAAPIRNLASRTIDAGSVISSALLPGSIADKVVGAYKKNLFKDSTLQDIPDRPRFVFNASNVQSGALWRFMKPYMRDWRVGEVKAPQLELAVVVAASSAFPPFLSPLELELDPASFTPNTGKHLQRVPYTSQVVLTDGGVYDNLGLETCWKKCKTILVSNGGAKMSDEPAPKRDWARHAYRVLNLIDNQVRSLRVRQLVDAYERGLRTGAYWGMNSNPAKYGLKDPLEVPVGADLARITGTPTRLAALEEERQESLIDLGYALCDTAMRRWVEPGATRPAKLPYGSGWK